MLKVLKNTRPITVKELKSMSQYQLDKLISFCWNDGKPRCWCQGIKNVTIINKPDGSIVIEWSDFDGDPHMDFFGNDDTEINNLDDGGEWSYGLYLKVDKKKPKLAKDLPEPPQITPELAAQIKKEAREWSEEFQKKVKKMELTPEDWRTIIK